jgi:mono/diheme cytochrome c family protein
MKTSAKATAVFAMLTFIFAASCSKSVSINSNAEKQTYDSTGVIKAVDPKTLSVTIDHRDIPGFMSAMEMTFPAANASLIENIAVGNSVAFVLERSSGKVVLVSLTKLPDTVTVNGEPLFEANCARCHGAKGEGAKKGIPLISGHALAHSEDEYIQQVVGGKAGKMPAFRDKLSDEQIAAIVKYVRTVIQADVKPEQREHKH